MVVAGAAVVAADGGGKGEGELYEIEYMFRPCGHPVVCAGPCCAATEGSQPTGIERGKRVTDLDLGPRNHGEREQQKEKWFTIRHS